MALGCCQFCETPQIWNNSQQKAICVNPVCAGQWTPKRAAERITELERMLLRLVDRFDAPGHDMETAGLLVQAEALAGGQ